MWTPTIGEKLKCKHDTREEAKEHDENAIGVYNDTAGDEDNQDEKELLLLHIPIELSKLILSLIHI